jgi:hypothetical protein
LQLQDIGALGYRSRKVLVMYLTKYFVIVKNIGNNFSENVEWQKVDIEINEMGLEQY